MCIRDRLLRISESEFYEWLFGPEKPSGLSRNGPQTCEKGASSWLTVITLKDMDFDLNKREFRDAVRL